MSTDEIIAVSDDGRTRLIRCGTWYRVERACYGGYDNWRTRNRSHAMQRFTRKAAEAIR